MCGAVVVVELLSLWNHACAGSCMCGNVAGVELVLSWK